MEYMLSPERKEQFASEFRDRLNNLTGLPVLPEIAHDLLALRSNPYASVANLVDVISKDPSITAQILRYARMSIFGYGNHIKTLHDAIQKVLSYEKGLHMAMGLAACQSLKLPDKEPLGGKRFWNQALYTAILTQALAKELPAENRPPLGLCYLSGLLHDIGLLLLGHLYPKEFLMLNNIAAKYHDRELRELEFQCLGISHDLTGVRLLQAWNLPEEIIAAVGEHHFPDYDGKNAIYPKLVYLARQLLKRPDATSNDLSELHSLSRFEELGFDEKAIDRALDSVRSVLTEVSNMAEDLVA